MTSAVVGIDPAAIAGWIEQLGIAVTGPLSFERIGLGQSNLTYLVRDAETGRDAATLKYWHTLGLWKIAVIGEGVMRRAMDEPQNRAAAGTPAAHWIDALVHRAREVAEDAGI